MTVPLPPSSASHPVIENGSSIHRIPTHRLPLVIGYTGYRELSEDIQVRKSLDQKIQQFFQVQQKRYSNSRFVLVGTFRGESDAIVTRIAEQEKIPLILVLPAANRQEMAEQIREEHRDLFSEVCARATKIVWLKEAHARLESTSGNETERTPASAYIARYSQIILAIRDDPNRELEKENIRTEKPKPGSSEEVIRFQKEGIGATGDITRREMLDIEGGMIYRIHVGQRKAHTSLSEGELQVSIEHSKDRGEERSDRMKRYNRLYQEFELFNADVEAFLRPRQGFAKKQTERQTELQTSKEYLLPTGEIDELPPEAQRFTDALMRRYALADTLALQFQRRTHFMMWVLFILAFATTYLLFLSYGRFQTEWTKPFYPVVIFLAFLIYRYVEWKRFQHKYLDYRGLAEALRIQLFWRLGGIEDSVSDHYVPIQRTDLLWIRSAARTATWLADLERLSVAELQQIRPQREAVEDHWLKGQESYFSGRAAKEKTFLLKLRIFGVVSLGVGFLWTVCRGLGWVWPSLSPDGWAAHFPGFIAEVYQPYLNVFFGLCVVAGTLILGYARTRGFAEHRNHSRRMRLIYRDGRTESQTIQSVLASRPPATPQNRIEQEWLYLLRRIGREALAENAAWILLHRERPLQVPR